MNQTSKKWMAYIDTEVRAACAEKGWGSQVRRKWTVRHKPVFASSVDDYEWKLIPGADARLPEQGPFPVYEGIYYVLNLNRRAKKVVLQHDTERCGDLGPHFWHESFTEIWIGGLGNAEYMGLLEKLGTSKSKNRVPVPPETGRLRDYLIDLTSRFKPNHFSLT